MGGNFLQVRIDRALHNAERRCPHSPLYEVNVPALANELFEAPDSEYSLSYLILLGVVTLLLIFLVAMLVWMIRCIVRGRHFHLINPCFRFGAWFDFVVA